MTKAAWSQDYLTRAVGAVDWKSAFDEAMEQHPGEFKLHFLADLYGRIEQAAGVSSKGGGIFEDLFRAGISIAEEDGDLESTISELLAEDFDGLTIDSPEWKAAKKRLLFAEEVLGLNPFLTYPEGLEDMEDEED